VCITTLCMCPHLAAGLVGPIIITAQGMANPDGTPMHVDRDIITVFHVSLRVQCLSAHCQAGQGTARRFLPWPLCVFLTPKA
jgi:hypothetical protein